MSAISRPNRVRRRPTPPRPAAVDAGTPPCIRIGWSGGGGHFIGVYGIEPTNLLWVTDPIYGQSLVSYTTLTGGTYQGNGTWTNTYFTH